MRLVRGLIGVMVVATLSIVVPGTSASAEITGTRLPFTGFSDMEVDGATGHVLITGGAFQNFTGSFLAVFDADGTYLQKVEKTGGAGGLALDETGRRVFVSLPAQHRIVVVDLDRLTKVDSFGTPLANAGPRSLALIGDRLWFGFGDQFVQPGGIGSVNLTTRVVRTFVDPSAYPSYDPELAGSSASNLLVTAEEGSSPIQLRVFDVSAGKPVSTASVFDAGGSGFGLGEMRLNAAGSKLLLGMGGPEEVLRFKLPTLAPVKALANTTYGIDALGGTAPGPIAAGQFNRFGKIEVLVMDGRTGTPISKTLYGRSLRFPAHGLAFSTDLSALYVITDPLRGRDRLHVVTDPVKSDATLTIEATPSPVSVGDTVWLQGSLAYLDGSSAAGRTLTIFRQNPDGSNNPLDVLLGTDSSGNWSVSDELPAVRGAYRYTVGVPGDTTHDGATASVYMQALGLPTTLYLDASDTTIEQGASVDLTAHLDAAAQTANQDVEIWAVPGVGARTIVAQGVFDGSGDFTTTVNDLTMNTSFVAMWGGDDLYEPTDSDPLAIGVRSTLTGSLDLASGTNGSISLYPYAEDCTTSGYLGCPYFGVTIAPQRQSVGLTYQVQQRVNGAWSDRAGWPYLVFTSYPTTTIVMGTPDPSIIGVRLRVRGTTEDDWANLGSSTGWFRFEITSDPPTTLSEGYAYHHSL